MGVSRPGPQRVFGFLVAVLLGTSLTVGVARAQSFGPPMYPDLQDPVVGDVARERPRRKSLPVIGVMADAGLPDGLMGALVVRPLSQLRLHVGGGSNSAGPGIRGGITALPFGSGISFSVEGGRYRDSDANALIQLFFKGAGGFSSYVGKASYNFWNAHTGLDFGERDVVFFLHAGFTFVAATLKDVAVPAEVLPASSAAGSTTVEFKEDPKLRLLSPSAKLGLILYLK